MVKSRVGPIEHANDHPWEFREGNDENDPFTDSWVSKPDKNGIFKWKKIGEKKNMIEFELARKNPITYNIKYDYKYYYIQLNKLKKDLNKNNILLFNCNYTLSGPWGIQGCYNFILDFNKNIVKKEDNISDKFYWGNILGNQKIIKQNKNVEYPYIYINDGNLFNSIISNGLYSIYYNNIIIENFENLNKKDKNKKEKEILHIIENNIKKYFNIIKCNKNNMEFIIQLKLK